MKPHELVDCPKCGQPAGKKCRTMTTRKSTDTHQVRIDLAYPAPAGYR